MRGWFFALCLISSLVQAQSSVIPPACHEMAAQEGLFLDAPRGEPVSENFARRLAVSYSNETTIQRSRYFNWNHILDLLKASRAAVSSPETATQAQACLRDEGQCTGLRGTNLKRAYCAQAFAEHALRYAMNYYEGIVIRCHRAFVQNQPQLFNARNKEELLHHADFRLHCVNDDVQGHAERQVQSRLLTWEESVRFLDRKNRIHRKAGAIEVLSTPSFSPSTSRWSVREWVRNVYQFESSGASTVRKALYLAFRDPVFAPAIQREYAAKALDARKAAYEQALQSSLQDSQSFSGTYGHAARALAQKSPSIAGR